MVLQETRWYRITTHDRDYGDEYPLRNCAELRPGAWWYRSQCAWSNLGSGQVISPETGMYWRHWKNYEVLKRSEMKIRHIQSGEAGVCVCTNTIFFYIKKNKNLKTFDCDN